MSTLTETMSDASPLAAHVARQAVTAEHVGAAILEHYLATGDGATADELAERLGCSVGTVRKRIAAAHGAPVGTYADREARASHSRNYPGMEAGAHHVTVYRPLPSTLRAEILRLRAAK